MKISGRRGDIYNWLAEINNYCYWRVHKNNEYKKDWKDFVSINRYIDMDKRKKLNKIFMYIVLFQKQILNIFSLEIMQNFTISFFHIIAIFMHVFFVSLTIIFLVCSLYYFIWSNFQDAFLTKSAIFFFFFGRHMQRYAVFFRENIIPTSQSDFRDMIYFFFFPFHSVPKKKK